MGPILYWYRVSTRPSALVDIHATCCTREVPARAQLFASVAALGVDLGRDLRRRRIARFEFAFDACCEGDEAFQQRWEDIYSTGLQSGWPSEVALRACSLCLRKCASPTVLAGRLHAIIGVCSDCSRKLWQVKRFELSKDAEPARGAPLMQGGLPSLGKR